MKKKTVLLFVLVFAVTFLAGYLGRNADASTCYYRCICSVPNKCCVNNGVETCKPVSGGPIQCPQNFPC